MKTVNLNPENMKTTKTLSQMMDAVITPQMLINSGVITYVQFKLYVRLIEPKNGVFFYAPPELIHNIFYGNIKKHIPLLPYNIHMCFPDIEVNDENFGKYSAEALLNERIYFYAGFDEIETVALAYIDAKHNSIGNELSRSEILRYSLTNFNPYINQKYEELEYYSYIAGMESEYASKKAEFDNRLKHIMLFMNNVKLINRQMFKNAVFNAHLLLQDSSVQYTHTANTYK